MGRDRRRCWGRRRKEEVEKERREGGYRKPDYAGKKSIKTKMWKSKWGQEKRKRKNTL